MNVSDLGGTAPRPMSGKTGSRLQNDKSFTAVLASQMQGSPNSRFQGSHSQGSHSQGNYSQGTILVGTITRETPTVSQLLYKSPLKNKCWQIIHDQANADKPFHRIRPGTQIHYNPGTGELVWGKDLDTAQAQAQTRTQPHTQAHVQPCIQPQIRAKASPPPKVREQVPPMELSEIRHSEPELSTMNLSDTAKQFIGRGYDQMNCYELLVGGLEELGVQYGGKGGLYEHLVNQASRQGLAKNHYLTGEGLVFASGTDVFKKTYYKVTDPAGTVDEIMADLEPRLEQGQVLSFSMKNRGHTGVISRIDGQWTFINSGTMDNNLAGENGKKGVGEESLKGELLNWFRLVNREKHALKITLGSLSPKRLSMFKPEAFSQKV